MARPVSEKYKLENVIAIIEEYTENTELPIFKEVCYKNNWDTSHIYDMARNNEELDHSIKKMMDKKEVELERGGLTGKYNKTMAVFSLKQLGWKDQIEINTDNSLDIKIKTNEFKQEDYQRIKAIQDNLFNGS